MLQNVPCDLVTGEERVCIDPEGRSAAHVACTIEMCSVNTPCMYAFLKKVFSFEALVMFVYKTGQKRKHKIFFKMNRCPFQILHYGNASYFCSESL